MEEQAKAELIGIALDEAVARAKGEAPGAAYSSDWSHGGRLIERERIELRPNPYGAKSPHGGVSWYAKCEEGEGRGDTALIAAMRAFVASKGA